ncbi:MAG TPA: lamin tail domain-containing protein, partial [Vulgatibacter sp.]
SFFASAAQPSSLDFEVVLRGDGTFDYRYGEMVAEGAPTWGRGAQASIGHAGASLAFFAEVPGGLEDRTFAFPAYPLPTEGSWTIAPAAGANVRLDVSNAHSADQVEATLEVWPSVRIVSARLATDAPAPGQPFVIEWRTENATAVRVEDEAGLERCVAAPSDLEQGSCAITEADFGDKVFVVHAEGGIGRNAAERAIDVAVYTPVSIDTFAAGPALVEIDDLVTVSWSTTNAATMTLTANGAPLDLTGKALAGDSLVLQPQIPTTYVLTIESSEGRTRTASRKVQVRTAFANSLSATSTQLLPGQATTIAWSTAGTDQVTVTDGPLAAPVELGPGDGFIDLEARPSANVITITGTTTNGSARIDLPEGFSFPYFGAYYDSLSFLINGHLSFDLAYTAANRANNPIPQANRKEVHLAPFWGPLNSKPSGVAVSPARFFWEHIDTGVDDFVVLQWSHMMFNSNNFNPSDLNFQVVLFRDGTFDFRYGTMTGTTAHEGTNCTIGYEDPTGTQGVLLSYNTAVPGGLTNRAWRFSPHVPATGSMEVTPAGSKTYRVCVTGAGGYVECRQERVVVLQPGDLAITELMLDPAGGAAERWFEVRNLSPDALDLEGMIVESTGGTPYEVGPLLLPAGGYATFAASAQVQGFTPDEIVGSDVALGSAGMLSLAMPYPPSADPDVPEPAPLVLANLTWSGTWAAAQPGTSLYLDPSFHFRGTLANSDRNLWCEGDATYDGANLGSPGAHGGSCK